MNATLWIAILAALLGLGVATVLLLTVAREPVDLDIGVDGLPVGSGDAHFRVVFQALSIAFDSQVSQ